MSSAWMCDGCGEFHSGFPDVEIDFDPPAREYGGRMHFDSVALEFPHHDTRVELCADCFEEAHGRLLEVLE